MKCKVDHRDSRTVEHLINLKCEQNIEKLKKLNTNDYKVDTTKPMEMRLSIG